MKRDCPCLSLFVRFLRMPIFRKTDNSLGQKKRGLKISTSLGPRNCPILQISQAHASVGIRRLILGRILFFEFPRFKDDSE